MKIGFSFGRCVRDIVNGRVSYDDVLYVISATDILNVDQMTVVIDEYLYRRDYLQGLDRAQCLDVAQKLWADQKILQPRRLGISASKAPEWGVWADLAITPQDTNPAIDAAWQQYRMLVDLCGQTNHVPQNSWLKAKQSL